MSRRPPRSPLFPHPTLFRSVRVHLALEAIDHILGGELAAGDRALLGGGRTAQRGRRLLEAHATAERDEILAAVEGFGDLGGEVGCYEAFADVLVAEDFTEDSRMRAVYGPELGLVRVQGVRDEGLEARQPEGAAAGGGRRRYVAIGGGRRRCGPGAGGRSLLATADDRGRAQAGGERGGTGEESPAGQASTPEAVPVGRLEQRRHLPSGQDERGGRSLDGTRPRCHTERGQALSGPALVGGVVLVEPYVGGP